MIKLRNFLWALSHYWSAFIFIAITVIIAEFQTIDQSRATYRYLPMKKFSAGKINFYTSKSLLFLFPCSKYDRHRAYQSTEDPARISINREHFLRRETTKYSYLNQAEMIMFIMIAQQKGYKVVYQKFWLRR